MSYHKFNHSENYLTDTLPQKIEQEILPCGLMVTVCKFSSLSKLMVVVISRLTVVNDV